MRRRAIDPLEAAYARAFAMPVIEHTTRTPEEEADFLVRKGTRLLTSAQELARDIALKNERDKEEIEKEEKRIMREEKSKRRQEEEEEKNAENALACFMVAHLGVDVLHAQLWRRLGVQEHPPVQGEKTKYTIYTNNVRVRSPLFLINNRNESLRRYREKKQRRQPSPGPPASAYAALPAPGAPAHNPAEYYGSLDG